jgi:hypothetical protein
MWIFGTNYEMRGNTLALGPLLRIRRVSAGGASGMEARASRTNSNLVMMADVLPQRWRRCGNMAVCWNIRRTVTHGAFTAYAGRYAPVVGFKRTNLAV